MTWEPIPPDRPKRFHGDRITPTTRLIGLVAGAIIGAAGVAIAEPLLWFVALVVATGALTARTTVVSVEQGALVIRSLAAPLRRETVNVVSPALVRGVEVIEVWDGDASPERRQQYRAVVHLSRRRRPVPISAATTSHADAEAIAAEMRRALARPTPVPRIPLRVPAGASERWTLTLTALLSIGAGVISASVAGGRAIDAVWPWAAATLAAGMIGTFATIAALTTRGTIGEVLPELRVIRLRRGIGHLGPRTVELPFDAITGIAVIDGARASLVIAERAGQPSIVLARVVDALTLAEAIRAALLPDTSARAG